MNTDEKRKAIVNRTRVVGFVDDVVIDTPEPRPVPRIIDVKPLGSSLDNPVGVAKSFVDSVAAGANVFAAASAAGVSLEVLERDSVVRQYIRQAKRKYDARASEIRDAVTLKWLETAFEDPDPRIRLVALRELSLIPEVGLKAVKGIAPAGRQLLSEETEAALDSLDQAEQQ